MWRVWQYGLTIAPISLCSPFSGIIGLYEHNPPSGDALKTTETVMVLWIIIRRYALHEITEMSI